MSFADQMFGMPRQTAAKMYGVTTGTVVANWDDAHPGMVQVQLDFMESGKNETEWIRVAFPYAGNGYGYYALPEVGDEVLVSFHMGMANCPYVIGSLHSSQNALPPQTAVEKNTIKRLKTKGGCELIFDDTEKKQTITIQTPQKMQVLLEDETQKITIADSNGENLLTIDGKNGQITVTAKQKLTLSAGGKAAVTIDGSGNAIQVKAAKIDVQADNALSLKGQTLKAEGTSVELKGSGSGKFESSGVLTLKGSMTKIN